jgi:hypothetical protein
MGSQGPSEPENRLPVDYNFEECLGSIETCANAYVSEGSESAKHNLIAVLDRLDELAEQSDRARAWPRMGPTGIGLGGLGIGIGPFPRSIGSTSGSALTEDVAGSEWECQVALVEAAKAAVEDPCDESLTALRQACLEVEKHSRD